MTFEVWLKKVDTQLVELIGCETNDLPDQDYWSYWDEGCPPSEMIDMLLGDLELGY